MARHMKACTKCKENKSLAEFGIHKRVTGGLRSTCKPCTSELTKEYNKREKLKDPELYRQRKNGYNRKKYREDPYMYKRWDLKKSYGITLSIYDGMVKSQNFCCAICKRHKSNFKRSLAVDHCHKTNKIRGLLCENCNRGLGLFYDNPSALSEAAKYLEKGVQR